MLLHYSDHGSGPILVLLHGMAGSLNYWQPFIQLASGTHRVIALDLLGFGQSPQSTTDYSASAHCQAIKDTLDHLKIVEPITLVGHSMGALVALKFARNYPDIISRLTLLNMPVFTSPEEARADITQGKKLLNYAYYGKSSRLLCNTWCYYLRPLSKRIAPLYLPSKPRQVASDSVLHSWQSYSESMRNIIELQSVQSDLSLLAMPLEIMYGTNESKIVLDNAHSMSLKENVSLKFIEGSHNLPLECPEEILDSIC